MALEPDEVEQLARAVARPALLLALARRVRIEDQMPACRRPCIPTCTFSIAVIVLNSLMFWNVRAMPEL